jgi:hypothetical protein
MLKIRNQMKNAKESNVDLNVLSSEKNLQGGILEIMELRFEENQINQDSSNCDCHQYGCTCIAYEKCCGCLVQ